MLHPSLSTLRLQLRTGLAGMVTSWAGWAREGLRELLGGTLWASSSWVLVNLVHNLDTTSCDERVLGEESRPGSTSHRFFGLF